jgi:hypothetical protein
MINCGKGANLIPGESGMLWFLKWEKIKDYYPLLIPR